MEDQREHTEWVVLPDAPDVPRLNFRRFRGEADFPNIAAVIEGSREADQLDTVATVEEISANYAHLTNCDPYQDMLFAEIDGQVVAYSRVFWEQEAAGDRIYFHFGYLLPEWRRRRIGTAMLHNCEHRLRQIAAEHAKPGNCYFRTWGADTEIGKLALCAAEGYNPIRYESEMVRSLAEKIPILPVPNGLEIRPVEEHQLRQIWDAGVEAFRDHWGFSEPSEEDYQSWQADPSFNPALWKVAWDGEEVAGMVQNFIKDAENQAFGRKRGYTENISVRRPWRRQGLARALIAESMRFLKELGMEEAALSVDTENLSGAFRLYEGLGYKHVKRWTTFAKPLELEA
jgi:ribosomal protein S18 acetylase RimI-like enzyme